jgi:hypothetical protein
MLVIAVVLAIAATGLGVIAYARFTNRESTSLLLPAIALLAALVLGAGAIALFPGRGPPWAHPGLARLGPAGATHPRR